MAYTPSVPLVAPPIDGVETLFAWDLALGLPQVLATSDGTKDLYGLERIGVEQAGAWKYALPDALGSMRQWSDPAGAVLAAQSYGPFGEARQPVGAPPWGYTGEWQDPAGMVYLRARWLNPLVGRFLSTDSMVPMPGKPQTLNRFAYCGNNSLAGQPDSGHQVVDHRGRACVGGHGAAGNRHGRDQGAEGVRDGNGRD